MLFAGLRIGETVALDVDVVATSLIVDGAGHCAGAVARDICSGAMETFDAKSVILAFGGNGQCYKPTTNALICTGNGITQAYHAGAPIMDSR